MPPAPRINRILFVCYLLLALAVFAAALISPRVRAVSYAPLRDLILPAPDPIVVSVLYSTEKAEWLTEAAQRFQASNPRLEGHPVELELEKMGSREMYLSILEGERQPDLISPASSLQVSLLEDLSAKMNEMPLVVAQDSEICRPVLQTPLVLVAWKQRADVLWPNDQAGSLWLGLHDALTDAEGWGAYGHPEWGYVKFGHTDPLKSNSGFQTLVLMTYGYFGKTSGLTSADILSDADYQQWLVELEGSVSKLGDSTGTFMQEIVAYGPSLYDVVAVYESTAIEQAENAVGRYGELQIYYPPATHLSDHPFCVIQADWVTREEAQAAGMFVDYLASEEIQGLALAHGFRPIDPGVSLDQAGSPFQRQAVAGLQIDLPPVVEVPPGDVLGTLLDFWARNVQR
jgi:ABC-type Fe3+ transport system substrate-binding protein